MPPKRPPAPVQTVRLDPDQLAEFARLLGREIAAAISGSPTTLSASPPKNWELLTTREASELIGISPSTMSVWRSFGKGPDYVKIGGKVRYRVDALEVVSHEWHVRHSRHAAVIPGRSWGDFKYVPSFAAIA